MPQMEQREAVSGSAVSEAGDATEVLQVSELLVVGWARQGRARSP